MLKRMLNLMRTDPAGETGNSSAVHKKAAIILCYLSLSLVGLVGVLSLPENATANPLDDVGSGEDRRVAKFVINNPNDRPIKYMMRWGESGVWNAFVLQPYHNYTHTHTLNQSGEFPGPHVRFDDASGTGTVKVQNLYVGKDYEFRFEGNHLKLYRTN
jgi:hypothetical protein